MRCSTNWAMKPNIAPNVWLHSSVGRASHRYRGGHGFEFREAFIFSRPLLSSCLSWKIYCDDHSSFSWVYTVVRILILCLSVYESQLCPDRVPSTLSWPSPIFFFPVRKKCQFRQQRLCRTNLMIWFRRTLENMTFSLYLLIVSELWPVVFGLGNIVRTFCSWMSNIHEHSRDSNGTRSLDSD